MSRKNSGKKRFSLFKPRTKETNFLLSVLMTTIRMLFVLVLLVGVSGTGLVVGIAKAYVDTAPVLDLSQFVPTTANVGAYIAIVLVIAVTFLFYRTTLGHDIKLVGANSEFARYAGINPKLTTIKCMCMSGAIAGIIGAIEVTAVQHRLITGFNPDLGFKGIVVSLLAGNNPIGVVFSGIFFGALKNGGTNMERMTGVPSAISSIVEGAIILVICADFTIRFVRKKKVAAAGKEEK